MQSLLFSDLLFFPIWKIFPLLRSGFVFNCFSHCLSLSFSLSVSLSVSISPVFQLLRIEPSTLHMLGKHFTTDLYCQPLFLWGRFSLWSPGWPWIYHLPALVPGALGWGMCHYDWHHLPPLLSLQTPYHQTLCNRSMAHGWAWWTLPKWRPSWISPYHPLCGRGLSIFYGSLVLVSCSSLAVLRLPECPLLSLHPSPLESTRL